MSIFQERTACRVCGGALTQVLDLGTPCLSGQFPWPGEADPPQAPLVLCRCSGTCGLVQLGHSVDPSLLYGEGYYYRSGVTRTMRGHLDEIASEALQLLGRAPVEGVLDIGANDGTLLSYFGPKTLRLAVDPCPVADEILEKNRADVLMKKRWPCDMGGAVDLIFSIACFYDTDDPVAFALSVHDYLTPEGLWCVEVANLWDMLAFTGYDSVCHEHTLYFDVPTLCDVLERASLRPVHLSFNGMNGGSVRVYACRQDSVRPAYNHLFTRLETGYLESFALRVAQHSMDLVAYLRRRAQEGLQVHLLGASTKMNTVLQLAGATSELIQMASERDERKWGRVTPGTRIPIVSEDESRKASPDIYLTVLGHFRDELIARERDFLATGGRLAFVLPQLDEVRG